jgi:membrane protease YdiL (CAAX protease family)
MGVVLIAPAIGVGEPGPARAVASLVPAAFHSRNTPLTWIAIVLALAVSSVVLTLVLWGEEFGWRGYLQLRLFPQHPLLAAMATGVIWGIWH